MHLVGKIHAVENNVCELLEGTTRVSRGTVIRQEVVDH